MPIQIFPATSADADILAPVGILAFSNDALNNYFGDPSALTPAQNEEVLQWRMRRFKSRADGDGKYWFKAIDSETGMVVGYSGILSPEAVKAKAGSITNGLDEGVPSFMDVGVIGELEESLEKFKKKCLGERKDEVWFVPSMVVHPSYRGQGIAGLLLAAEFALADQAGGDVFLESTPIARGVYLKAGFEAIGTLDLTEQIGSEYFLTAMLRRAMPPA